ncbi:MAG: tRNA (adenosine(37)-N6)-threonylcarbamoyltransferase complex ATPase subunit type 1 TsaE [Planctomycetota bacterium]
MIKIISNSPAETIRLGERFAHLLKDGDFIGLIGILGAGKTYFTKGIAKGLGVPKKHHITSPTFVLGNLYHGKKMALYHFDAYRLNNPRELLGLGFGELHSDNTVTVLEWADKLLPLIQKKGYSERIIKVRFKIIGSEKRLITFDGVSHPAWAGLRCRFADPLRC